MNTLQELCLKALARDAAAEAIEFEDKWVTWGEMRRLADQLRGLVEQTGVGPKSRIAFAPRNRPVSIAALLGMIAMGRSVRTVYAFQSAASLARDLGRVNPAILVGMAADFTPEVVVVLKQQGTAAIALEGMNAFAVPSLERLHGTHAEDAPDDPEIQLLTSGTTGTPKPFSLSYDVIAKHHVGTASLMTPLGGDGKSAAPGILYFPVGNISGIYTIMPSMLSVGRAVLLERFSLDAWHKFVLRYRPEASGVPPSFVQALLDANIPREDLASIRYFGSGAAPLDPSVQQAFEARYAIPVLVSYGATEFGGPVTGMTPALYDEWGKKKIGSVGRPLPGAKLRVIDPESGPESSSELPRGQFGILEVVSPRFDGGWIRTSDIGMIDEDGFVWLRGRADGAIIRGGFKIVPETIENAMMLHPVVSAVAVVGVPDQRLGQVPAAAVCVKPDAPKPTVEELEKHLRQHVLATHIPVEWRFIDSLPKTPASKIDRKAVRALFEAERTPATNACPTNA